MMKLKYFILALSVFLIIGCKKNQNEKIGNLSFVANGEAFVANGFKSKDGWKISFTNVILNISDVSVTSKDAKKL